MNTASDPEEGVDNVVKSVVKKGKLSGLILDVDGLMKDWGEEIIHTEETIVSHFADLSAKTVPRFK